MRHLSLKSCAVLICALTMTACTTPGTGPTESSGTQLVDRTFQIQDVSDRGVIDNSNITLRFGADGQFSGSTGCNTVFGPYTRVGDRVEFGALGATKKLCPPALMNQEADVLGVLEAANMIEFDRDGALVLKAGDGRYLKGFEQTVMTKVATYRCADGTTLEATYPSSDTARVTYGGRTVDMRIAQSASGARYTGGGLEWWTRGMSEGYLSPLAEGEDTASAPGQTCTAV